MNNASVHYSRLTWSNNAAEKNKIKNARQNADMRFNLIQTLSKLKIRPKLINPNEYDSAALLFNFARLSFLSLIIEGNNYFLENRRK